MNTLFNHPFFLDIDRCFNGYCESKSEVIVDKDEKGWKVFMSVPGLTKDDLEINVKDGVISISYKNEEKNDEQLFVSDFTKSYKLPDDVNVDKIGGKVVNGILEISLPFDKKKIKSRQIEIH